MHIINCPSVPYWGHIPEGVRPGTVIQVDAHIPNHCHKFEINLYAGNEVGHHAEKHSDIALQIRPKIHNRKIILNSRRCGDWGCKEKHRDIHHLCHGSTLNMQIIAEHQHFRVVINGHTISTFYHRIPMHEVRVFNIDGHLDVHRIEYRNQYAQPSGPIYPSASVYPSAPAYPSAPPAFSAPAYPSANVYPAPLPQPVYARPPPVVTAAYVPPTVIVEEGHHHHHHHGGLIDTIFGHHHHDHHDHPPTSWTPWTSRTSLVVAPVK